MATAAPSPKWLSFWSTKKHRIYASEHMSKTLPIGLCIILTLVGSIVLLASPHSMTQAQERWIIVEEAEYVSINTTAYSVDLLSAAENVTPRIVSEYAESDFRLRLYKSDDLSLAADAVSPRIIVEYADFLSEYDLQPVTVPDIDPRIVVEYVDSVFSNELKRPPAPLTSPPVTNVSLAGVLGRGGWFTSNVEVNLSANVPVEKTEYSLDSVTWIDYTAPFILSNEGYNHIYFKSIDEAGNVESVRTEIVKIDKTLPSVTILIDDGNSFTNSRNVALTLSGMDAISGVSQMRFSNYGTDNTWTSWETYATSRNWTVAFDWNLALQAKNVSVTVYAQCMDNAGLISTSSDTIVLSVRIPTPVVLNSPSDVRASSVTLHWSRNNDPDFLCYEVIVSRYPMQPSSGYSSDQIGGQSIYDQQTISYQVTGLDSSTAYYFVVRTFNEQGAYYDSNSVATTTTSSAVSGIVPWQLATALWMIGAVVTSGGMGFAIYAGKSPRIVRRMLVTAIIFGLSFTIYYPIAQFPANARDPLPFFYLELATVLFVTFLFSAFEKGLGWPFIFGNSLTWGLVLGYNFFFGYPYWLIVAYLIGEGLFFGFLYAFLGAAGQRFTGWVQNLKIAAQLKAQEEEEKKRVEEERKRIEAEREQFEILTSEARSVIEKSKTTIKDPEILSALIVLEVKISNMIQDFEAGTISFSEAKSGVLEVKGLAETLGMPRETLYDILGVSPKADQEEIKKAYRERIIEYHPDKVGSWANMDKIPNWVKKESNEMTKRINEAYETLSNISRRKEYDERIGV